LSGSKKFGVVANCVNMLFGKVAKTVCGTHVSVVTWAWALSQAFQFFYFFFLFLSIIFIRILS